MSPEASQQPTEPQWEDSPQREARLRREATQQAVEQQVEEEDVRKARARRLLYKDVEELLMVGFLSHQVRVGDTNLSLRSLSPGDTFLLRHRVGRSASARLWKTWTVATAVWMVDGINLLGDPHAIHAVYRSVSYLPKPSLEILFSCVIGLLNRLGTAVKRTEAYCYETYSRVTWRVCGRESPMRDDFTGVPGSGGLGMNHVQQMWVAYNLAEDERLRHIQEWQSAKLVASASSPKGVKKLNRADEALRNKENRRRRDAIARMVNDAFYGDTPQEAGEMVVMVRGEPVVVPRVKTARTADELSEQMRAWVAGEKDWHDIVVDTYKQRIRDQFDQEKQRREQAAATQLSRPGVTGGANSIVGYTPDQIREMRPDLFERRSGTKRVFDNDSPVTLYHKYLAEDRDTGPLRADDAGVYVEDEDEEGQQGLQGAVAGRRPGFSSEPIGTPMVRTPQPKGDR